MPGCEPDWGSRLRSACGAAAVSTLQSAIRRSGRCSTALSVLTLTLIIGCDARQDALGRLPGDGSLLIVIGPSQTDPAWPAIRGGVRRFAQHAAYLRIETIATKQQNIADKRALFERELAREPAAIVLFVTDPIVDRRLAERATERGIVLVTVGARIEGARPFAHVEVDYPNAAERLAERLMELSGGRRTYALLHERGKDELATRVHDHFMRIARPNGLMVMLEQTNLHETRTSAPSAVSSLLTRFRHLGLVVVLSNDVDPRLLKPSDHPAKLVLLSATPNHWPALAEGRVATLLGPLDGDIGYSVARVAAEGLNGDIRPGRVHGVACEIVDQAGLSAFEARYRAAAELDRAHAEPADRQ